MTSHQEEIPVASVRPSTPPSVIGLPVTQAEAFTSSMPYLGKLSASPRGKQLIQYGEGVTDPRHLTSSRSNVWCRHIHSRSEEAILLQLDSIASGPRRSEQEKDRQRGKACHNTKNKNKHSFDLVIFSSSITEYFLGSIAIPPFAPPKGTFTTAHLNVIRDAEASTCRG